MFKLRAIFFLAVLLIASCAPSRFVKPLASGEESVSVSLGGPLIGFSGTTIPIPFTTLAYGKGLDDRTTVFGSLHITSFMYGNLQSDIGILREIIPYDTDNRLIPGLSGTFVVNPVYNLNYGSFKIWPQIDFNTYWHIHKDRKFVYLGLSSWFETARTRAHGEEQPNQWLFHPHFGISQQNRKWVNQLELKFLSPNISNENIVVDYRSIGNFGAIGVYYSISRRF